MLAIGVVFTATGVNQFGGNFKSNIKVKGNDQTSS